MVRGCAALVLAGCGRLSFEAPTVSDDAPGAAITVTFGERTGADVQGVTRDNNLYAPSPQANYGASVLIEVDPNHVGLLELDLSSIPTTAVVMSAHLTLDTQTVATPDTIEVFPMLEDWDEGATVGGAGTSNFNERLPGTPWTGAGASGGSRGGRIAAIRPLQTLSTYTVAIETETVQGWISDPSSNHGLALALSGTAGCHFASREGDASARPMLTVTYVP